ncbi:glutamate synthase-related protein [Streptomyces sp. NPDC049910]|uniref:glutamate synthase-related protein n=1 Tax=Streptomyces sp. NPDC049910 TaxID=3155278 RepID=UPI00343A6E59
MTSRLTAVGFPEDRVRERARTGAAAVFPLTSGYGTTLWGAGHVTGDLLDAARLVPPVFMPQRLEKLIELGREPHHDDVDLGCTLGGFGSPLPLYVSAFGSTRATGEELGEAVARQAGRLGIPLVIGENIVPVNGYRHAAGSGSSPLLGRIRAYAEAVEDAPEGCGGAVVQQSTEDADSEVWNLVYSDPAVQPLHAAGRLAFELKVGQGAKPGLGGMTVLPLGEAEALAEQYRTADIFGQAAGGSDPTGADRQVLRTGSPGTFTEEILRHQVRLMRNNFPRARVWVKLHPGRDVALAAATAWQAGADAVTIDGAEGGTGWAPLSFLDHVGLPLADCLRAVDAGEHCLLVTGRIWEGVRALKTLALGARGVGLGRAALLAADEDREAGLLRLVESIALELRLLISALGKYRVDAVDAADLLLPDGSPHHPPQYVRDRRPPRSPLQSGSYG